MSIIKSTVIIPTHAASTPRWNMSVDLSGKRYQFYISWNTIEEAWELSISDVNGALLLGGLRLQCGCLFLARYKPLFPELPAGDFMLVDKEDDLPTAYVTRDNLSARFSLVYYEMEED
jgi:hypothetical protein